jgi:hypothetical protein
MTQGRHQQAKKLTDWNVRTTLVAYTISLYSMDWSPNLGRLVLVLVFAPGLKVEHQSDHVGHKHVDMLLVRARRVLQETLPAGWLWSWQVATLWMLRAVLVSSRRSIKPGHYDMRARFYDSRVGGSGGNWYPNANQDWSTNKVIKTAPPRTINEQLSLLAQLSVDADDMVNPFELERGGVRPIAWTSKYKAALCMPTWVDPQKQHICVLEKYRLFTMRPKPRAY